MPWKRTTKWRPCQPQTNSTASGGGPVESESAELGYAKSVFPHKEKVASDLAAIVGVSVPRVWIDKVEGRSEHHAISEVVGSESVDAPLLRSRLGKVYESAEVQAAFRRASGLLPFHAWLATEDLKDQHLVVSQNGGSYEVAAIDFAFSMNAAADAPVVAPNGPPALVANVDKEVVRDTVARIEAVTDDQIRELVDGVPDEVLPRPAKDELSARLCSRRGRIRDSMKGKGWLP